MKITRVKFKSSNQPTTGVRSSMGYLGLGDACDPQWGAGSVGSMQYDKSNHSLAVRKADGKPFERTMPQQRDQMPTFDVLLIPWDNIDFACGCDEVDAKPQSKPVGQAEIEELKALRADLTIKLENTASANAINEARAESAEAAAGRLTRERDELAKQVEQLTAPPAKPIEKQGQQRR